MEDNNVADDENGEFCLCDVTFVAIGFGMRPFEPLYFSASTLVFRR